MIDSANSLKDSEDLSVLSIIVKKYNDFAKSKAILLFNSFWFIDSLPPSINLTTAVKQPVLTGYLILPGEPACAETLCRNVMSGCRKEYPQDLKNPSKKKWKKTGSE